MFSPPTCVGFGYGQHSGTLTRSFSWKQGITKFRVRKLASSPLDIENAFVAIASYVSCLLT